MSEHSFHAKCENQIYGVTLSGQDSTAEWDAASDDETYPKGKKLIVKQILLGAKAEENEYNVVEVCTAKGSLTIPIAVLKVGELRTLNPNIEFCDSSATFKLIKGNGPVHILGQNIKDDAEPIDMSDEDFGEEDGEEKRDDAHLPKKKQKAENNGDSKSTKNNKK